MQSAGQFVAAWCAVQWTVCWLSVQQGHGLMGYFLSVHPTPSMHPGILGTHLRSFGPSGKEERAGQGGGTVSLSSKWGVLLAGLLSSTVQGYPLHPSTLVLCHYLQSGETTAEKQAATAGT